MNIVIGICGIGFGHSIRQRITIDLLMPEHNIALLVFGNSILYFQEYYPQLPLFEVKVPWVCTSKKGMLYKETAMINSNTGFFKYNFLVFAEIVKYFSNKIDLVISDYEPNSAQLAYASGSRLITLDQQSKYLGYNLPDIGELSRIEEKSRLRYFFPQAFKRIAMSFHEIEESPDPEFAVKIIPARIRRDIERNEYINNDKTNIVTLYLSTHSPINQSIESILIALKAIKNYTFNVFAPNSYLKNVKTISPNVRFYSFSHERFIISLRNSHAVISTAGHTLLAELIALKLPTFAIPLDTYDQHYCAHIIENFGFGMQNRLITKENLELFFDNNKRYKQTLAEGVGCLGYGFSDKQIDELIIQELLEYD